MSAANMFNSCRKVARAAGMDRFCHESASIVKTSRTKGVKVVWPRSHMCNDCDEDFILSQPAR